MKKDGGQFESTFNLEDLKELKNNKSVINFFSTAIMAAFVFTSYNFFLKNYQYSGLKALQAQKTIKL